MLRLALVCATAALAVALGGLLAPGGMQLPNLQSLTVAGVLGEGDDELGEDETININGDPEAPEGGGVTLRHLCTGGLSGWTFCQKCVPAVDDNDTVVFYAKCSLNGP